MPQHQEASGTRTTIRVKTFTEKNVLLKERNRKRAERAEARRVKAEEHHNAGNAYFLKGEYREAIAEFEVAIQVNGPTALYLSNMAAAWLKLKAYDSAEQCATRALRLDPQFKKARFRRGQARKESLQLAAAGIDFATVLRQDPDLIEAKRALDEIVVLMAKRNENDLSVVDLEDRGPSINDPKTELESVSDSSDWHHEGNGFPCPFYNNNGCARVECEFSHAPDHTGKSVRDRLGRNVCVRFLLGDCFGRCVFSHEKNYLPSGRWWESEEKRAEVRDMSTWDIVTDLPGTLPKCLASIDGRMVWKPNHAAKTEEACVWKDSVIKLEGLGDLTHDMTLTNFMNMVGGTMARWPGHGHRSGQRDEPEQDGSEESEERSSNGGFDANPADVCQCEGLPRGPWFGGYYDHADDQFHDICIDVNPP